MSDRGEQAGQEGARLARVHFADSGGAGEKAKLIDGFANRGPAAPPSKQSRVGTWEPWRDTETRDKWASSLPPPDSLEAKKISAIAKMDFSDPAKWDNLEKELERAKRHVLKVDPALSMLTPPIIPRSPKPDRERDDVWHEKAPGGMAGFIDPSKGAKKSKLASVVGALGKTWGPGGLKQGFGGAWGLLEEESSGGGGGGGGGIGGEPPLVMGQTRFFARVRGQLVQLRAASKEAVHTALWEHLVGGDNMIVDEAPDTPLPNTWLFPDDLEARSKRPPKERVEKVDPVQEALLDKCMASVMEGVDRGFKSATEALVDELFAAFQFAGSRRTLASRMEEEMRLRDASLVADRDLGVARWEAQVRDLREEIARREEMFLSKREEWRKLLLMASGHNYSIQKLAEQLDEEREASRTLMKQLVESRIKMDQLKTSYDEGFVTVDLHNAMRKRCEDLLRKETAMQEQLEALRAEKERADLLEEKLATAEALKAEIRRWVQHDASMSLDDWDEDLKEQVRDHKNKRRHDELHDGDFGFAKMLLDKCNGLTVKKMGDFGPENRGLPLLKDWLCTFLPVQFPTYVPKPKKAPPKEEPEEEEPSPAKPAMARRMSMTDAVKKAAPAAGIMSAMPKVWLKCMMMKKKKGEDLEHLPGKSVYKLLLDIYDEKIEADEVDDREGNSRQTLPEFVYDFLLNRYGLGSLAEKHLGVLIRSLQKYAGPDNYRINTFMRFASLGQEAPHNLHPIPLDGLNVFLGMFHSLRTGNSGQAMIENDKGELWAAMNRVKPALSLLTPIDVRHKVAAKCPKMKKDKDGKSRSYGFTNVDEVLAKSMDVWMESYFGDDAIFEAFDRFDKDGGGTLDLNEFRCLVREFDPERSERQVLAIYREALQLTEEGGGAKDSVSKQVFAQLARKHRLLVQHEASLSLDHYQQYDALVDAWKIAEPQLSKQLESLRLAGYNMHQVQSLKSKQADLERKIEVRDATGGWRVYEELVKGTSEAAAQHNEMVAASNKPGMMRATEANLPSKRDTLTLSAKLALSKMRESRRNLGISLSGTWSGPGTPGGSQDSAAGAPLKLAVVRRGLMGERAKAEGLRAGLGQLREEARGQFEVLLAELDSAARTIGGGVLAVAPAAAAALAAAPSAVAVPEASAKSSRKSSARKDSPASARKDSPASARKDSPASAKKDSPASARKDSPKVSPKKSAPAPAPAPTPAPAPVPGGGSGSGGGDGGEGELQRLAGELAAAQREAEDARRSAEELARQRAEFAATADRLRAQMAASQAPAPAPVPGGGGSELQRLAGELAAAQREAEEARRSAEELARQRAEIAATADMLRAQMAASQQEAGQRVSRASEDFDAAARDFGTEVDQLRAQLEKSRGEAEAAQAELEAARHSGAAQASQVLELRAALEEVAAAPRPFKSTDGSEGGVTKGPGVEGLTVGNTRHDVYSTPPRPYNPSASAAAARNDAADERIRERSALLTKEARELARLEELLAATRHETTELARELQSTIGGQAGDRVDLLLSLAGEMQHVEESAKGRREKVGSHPRVRAAEAGGGGEERARPKSRPSTAGSRHASPAPKAGAGAGAAAREGGRERDAHRPPSADGSSGGGGGGGPLSPAAIPAYSGNKHEDELEELMSQHQKLSRKGHEHVPPLAAPAAPAAPVAPTPGFLERMEADAEGRRGGTAASAGTTPPAAAVGAAEAPRASAPAPTAAGRRRASTGGGTGTGTGAALPAARPVPSGGAVNPTPQTRTDGRARAGGAGAGAAAEPGVGYRTAPAPEITAEEIYAQMRAGKGRLGPVPSPSPASLPSPAGGSGGGGGKGGRVSEGAARRPGSPALEGGGGLDLVGQRMGPPAAHAGEKTPAREKLRPLSASSSSSAASDLGGAGARPSSIRPAGVPALALVEPATPGDGGSARPVSAPSSARRQLESTPTLSTTLSPLPTPRTARSSRNPSAANTPRGLLQPRALPMG